MRFFALLLFVLLGASVARADAPNFLASTKTVNKTSTYLLDTVTYTIKLDNTLGTADALDVNFVDQLPRGLDVQLFSLDGVPQPLSLLSDGLAVGTVAAGTSRTVSITGLVSAIPTRPDAAQFINTANWSYRYRPTAGAAKVNASFDTNSVTTKMVRLEPSMAIATVNLGTVLGVNLGNEITYTLTIANTGTLDSAGTTLTDAIPVGATYVAGSTKLNGVALPDLGVAGPFVLGGLVNSPGRAVGQIGAGETATVTFKVRSLILPVVNLSIVDADGLGPIPPLNVSGSTTTQTVDLSLVKTDGRTSAAPGNTLSYTLSVKNNGGATLNSVRVVDTLPLTLQNPVWTASSGTYNASTGQWTGLSLAAGQTVVLTLQTRVSSLAVGSVTNAATVFAPDGTLDSNQTNNSSSDTDTLSGEVDLEVSQSDGVTIVTAGLPLSYRITVKNNGPSALSSFTLTDSPPAALQNPVYSPDEGAYNAATGVWSGLDFRPGQSVQITLSGLVAAGSTGTLTHTVSVSPPLGTVDLVSGNNSSTDTNTIAPPSLVLVQSVDKTQAKTGETITYTIAYRNGGGAAVSGVAIRTAIPSFTAFSSASFGPLAAGLTGCVISSPAVGATGNIDWNFSGNLPPGGNGVVTFRVVVQ